MSDRQETPGLLIFDCDGVLVDSEIIAARMLVEALAALGWPMSVEDCLARYSGISMASVVARIEAEWGRPLPEGFLADLRARDAEAFRRELRPIEGVKETLEGLTWRKCVASSGTVAKMRTTLGLTGLWPLFEPNVFSAEMVQHGKPAPDLFLLAAERMQAAPGDCLVIEDSVPGVQAGRAAGMCVLGFTGGSHCRPDHGATLLAAGAHTVFHDMRALPDLLAGDRSLRAASSA